MNEEHHKAGLRDCAEADRRDIEILKALNIECRNLDTHGLMFATMPIEKDVVVAERVKKLRYFRGHHASLHAVIMGMTFDERRELKARLGL